MSYWQFVQTAAGMHGSYTWLLVGLIVSALLLGVIAPSARRRLRATVFLVLLSFVGLLVCVVMQWEQSISVGDWVRIGEPEGLVREIRWRQTSIETRNWDTVVIPNSLLMKSQVTVLARRSGQPRYPRMGVAFNVDYRHSPA